MNKIIPYILWAACVLSACSTDYYEPDSVTPGDTEMLTLTVTASQPVAYDGVSTRAKNDDDVLYTEFERGDSIGVIVMDAAGNLLVDNVPYRYDGSNWIFDADKDGEDKRPYYDAAMSKYIVYFPYKPSADGIQSVESLKGLEDFKHQEDQHTKEKYLSSDIMVWTSEGKPIKRIEAGLTHVYNTFSLVQPKVKWDIVPTGEEIVYTAKDETLSDLIIEYAPENGEIITLKDNDTDLMYRGTDRSYRYLIPEEWKGKIMWQYTYRGITFHGEWEISANLSGTRISSSDTGYMGKLPGPKMEFSDFYCSNYDEQGNVTGYVIPWDAEECLKNRHCIGLVARVGQNQDDLSDYSGSGIGKSTCQGYVIALTDTFSEPFLVKNGDNIALPWGSEKVKDEFFTNPITQDINDWSGYYNHHKIIEYAEDKKNELTLKDFPAAYTCENYGKYTVDTNENGEPIEVPVPDGSHTGLEAPRNTSGWFLPTTHMLFSVNGRNKFEIGGTWYETDEVDHAIDKLINDRLEIIKEYAIDLKEDPIYDTGICKYLDFTESLYTQYYWGSNHENVKEFSITNISGITYGYCPKNGIKKGNENYEVKRARAFLAF